MILPALMALALAAAAPDVSADAPRMPTTKAEPFTPAPEDPFPVGAPTDDYGFVSWCYGALNGHMDLYKLVKPELDKQSTNPKEDAVLDAEQMQAGREYLTLYKRAMEAAEKASPQAINVRGAQAVKVGANIWTPALQADVKTRMWSYLSWELPGRCETTAEKLYEKSLLAAQMLGVTIEDDTKPAAKPAAEAPVAQAPTPEAKPIAETKPKPAPATVSLRGLQ